MVIDSLHERSEAEKDSAANDGGLPTIFASQREDEEARHERSKVLQTDSEGAHSCALLSSVLKVTLERRQGQNAACDNVSSQGLTSFVAEA